MAALCISHLSLYNSYVSSNVGLNSAVFSQHFSSCELRVSSGFSFHSRLLHQSKLGRTSPSPYAPTRSRAFSKNERELASKAISASEKEKNGEPSSSKPSPVVIIPGYLADASEYIPMATFLRERGFTATVVPIRWYHWIPTMGGRSMRPILDRIDATLAHVLDPRRSVQLIDSDSEGERGGGAQLAGATRTVEESIAVSESYLPQYGFWDWLKEMRNASIGAQPPPLMSLRDVVSLASASVQEADRASAQDGNSRQGGGPDSAGEEGGRIALVGHSAGGWVARILLGAQAPYDGRTYAASRHVHTLVTLGTPHICTDKLTSRNIEFVNRMYPGTFHKAEGVRYICVGGRASQGRTWLGGLIQDLAYQSYVLCCGRGDVWGDGITPVECSLGLPGAEPLVLEGVSHAPRYGKWYGTPEIIETWLPYLRQETPAPAPTAVGGTL